MEDYTVGIIGVIIASIVGIIGVLLGQKMASKTTAKFALQQQEVNHKAALEQQKADLDLEYEAKLRESRITAYQQLTSKMIKFGFHNTAEPVFPDIENLFTEMSSWYYKQGGLLMTPASFFLFQRLQVTLEEVINEKDQYDEKQKDINKRIRRVCSQLRSSLVWEVGTRGDPKKIDPLYDELFGGINEAEKKSQESTESKKSDKKFKEEIKELQDARKKDKENNTHRGMRRQKKEDTNEFEKIIRKKLGF